ncbi:MAG: metallophosphoesterase [Thermomonas sp.]
MLASCVYGFVIEPSRLVERDYTLPLSNWPVTCDGLRVDVVTDVHTGSPRNGLDKLDRVVASLANSDADIVLMAGDYVILSVLAGTYVPAQTIAEHLKPLTASKPVYAVLGNHDWWKNGPQVSRAFAGAGVHMIDNMASPIDVRDCHFWLAGLGDLLEGRPDVQGTFAMIPVDAPVIAITHEPALWPRIPAQATLTVAGHTHGGQINPFGLLTPDTFKPYSHQLNGRYLVDGRSLFVSPGIGTSILPMRLGVPPEISRLTLRRAN